MCKRTLPLLILFLFLPLYISAETSSVSRKLIRGFDGGMMLHTGFLKGDIAPADYSAEGMPLGIGGVIRLHLGERWRIGTEGYMSNLNQLDNGSYIRYGWGGLLADYSWRFQHFSIYAGLTAGGGANTDLLMFDEASSDWGYIDGTLYQKQTFLALDPFCGVELQLSDALRLTLKCDFLKPLSANSSTIPIGPRLYLGFIFSH